ncbi:LytR C-terminal domain-containing protein [uncultured Bifidobacterium sp.]|uniref:LytR C-terminal domain-containing protein n=1 Tax=uncultured Bifidobacterium sp. TaxID=165187 RepID=UPI0028DCEB9E|nr:LytR C-terminal domain-containing protein [uncultured Bifidobacterium sp.]
MTKPNEERAMRRRYVAKHHRIVLSVVSMILVVALVISCFFYFHIGGAGAQKTTTTAPNYGVTAPCAPNDSNGNKSKYVANSNVTIRVLNGTSSSGFAKAVGDALENRSFTVSEISNYSSTSVERTTIYFGRNAIAQGYTVNSNFKDAIMVMDDRTDKLVDVVLGASFTNLRSKRYVPTSGADIVDIKGCVSASSMTNLPKAISHDAVN